MRRVILLAATTLALVLAAPASSATVTVSIKRTGFTPASVTINQDDSVTWTNNDTIDHQIVANGGQFGGSRQVLFQRSQPLLAQAAGQFQPVALGV